MKVNTNKNRVKAIRHRDSQLVHAYREAAKKTFLDFRKTFELLGSFRQHKNA